MAELRLLISQISYFNLIMTYEIII